MEEYHHRLYPCPLAAKASEMKRLVTTFVAVTLALASIVPLVNAHDAPAGWTYGWDCCNITDCRQVSGSASKSRVTVTEVTGGYRVNRPGTIPDFIPWDSPKIRPSKDDEYHWCSAGGGDTGATICLYVPNHSY